jgi:CHAT domain-containing protein
MSLSTALSQAQRDMINSDFNPRTSRGMQSIEWHSNMNDVVNSKETKFASPYFWAPFVIIGSPNLN